VAETFEQLGHALGAAHDAGVVHRDLKPENIFLARSMRAGRAREVKVLDFGVAKIVAEGTQAKTTSAVGTPLWLAPETMQGRASPASDVWALGLIAFDMLVGFNFWRATDAASPGLADVLREITLEPIPLASARAAQKGRAVPAGFDGWFQRCVARDPAARFPSARQAFAALAPVLAMYPSAPPPALIATPPPGSMAAVHYSNPPPPASSSWGVGTVLVVLVVVFALVGTGIWALVRIL
jgi:serine/threonine-protein kinase